MKNSNYFKIASTLLALLVFAGCASLPMQQSEYDDVYFTSADRTKPKKVVIDPEGKGDLGEDVVTLEKSSDDRVEADLINKYNNGTPKEVVYFEEIEPKVSRASELNYDDFVWDYENELLENYDLPLDWDNMDALSFNQIVRNDLLFRNAWYDQYYRGQVSAMENYLSQTSALNAPSSRARNININLGFGLGFGSIYNSSIFWGNPYFAGGWADPFWRFGNPYFYTSRYSFYDPFFYDPFFYDPWFNNRPWRYRRNFGYWGGGNTIIIANNDYYYGRNGRDFTRSSRVPSTSITSVRSDAANGTGRTRSSSAALDNASRTRSTISSGRVSNTSVRPSTMSGTRSSRSTSSIDEALSRSSNRVRTDAYRISSNGKSRSSSGFNISSLRRSSGSTRASGLTYNPSSRTRASIPSYTRTSTTSRNSGVSFNRNTSSRSSSSVFRNSSRYSSNRSSSFSRSSSSSRSSGSYSRSSSSSSRSSGGSVRSSSSGSSGRSSGSSGSSRSSSSSSGSRGGRGN